MKTSRYKDVETFYGFLKSLVDKQPVRRLGSCSGRDGWPDRGVYFFFENGEGRDDGSSRVVRVGTHALLEDGSSTLWGRLAQHRGTLIPKGGNHRGSVFRLLVGAALAAKHDEPVPSWGVGNSPTSHLRDVEHALESAVSDVIGAMQVAWLEIPDDPGPESLRGYIERNAIALLSNYGREAVVPPSEGWLGHYSNRGRVRESGLWNNNHVDEQYDPEFLKVMATLIDGRLPSTFDPSDRRTIVMQCAKSKMDDGWFRDGNGNILNFVADPERSSSVPLFRPVHPDDDDGTGETWRSRLLKYNQHYSATGENPFGLHAAGALYRNPAYAAVSGSLPAENFYILSACWGLVRSDFLIPNYNVSFSRSQGVPAYAVRSGLKGWQDFNMLDLRSTLPLIYVGGRSYLQAFALLSGGYQGPRIAYHNLSEVPEIDGIEMRRFDTAIKTNWYYQLAHELVEGHGSLPSDRTAPVRESRKTQNRAEEKQKRGYGKYTGLYEFLTGLPPHQKTVTLTFAEIEKLLAAPLPQSARTYVAVWWANGGHPQARAWLAAGFRKVSHHLEDTSHSSWIRFERAG